jgi:hypothetical protein
MLCRCCGVLLQAFSHTSMEAGWGMHAHMSGISINSHSMTGYLSCARVCQLRMAVCGGGGLNAIMHVSAIFKFHMRTCTPAAMQTVQLPVWWLPALICKLPAQAQACSSHCSTALLMLDS